MRVVVAGNECAMPCEMTVRCAAEMEKIACKRKQQRREKNEMRDSELRRIKHDISVRFGVGVTNVEKRGAHMC